MNKFFLAAAVAASLVIGMPLAADAHSNVEIFFGFPHYSYQVGPDYRYRFGYGWYSPNYRYERRRYQNMARLSCGEAKWTVRQNGYRNVSTVECRGVTFTFRGTRNGRLYVLYVNSRTGGMWRG